LVQLAVGNQRGLSGDVTVYLQDPDLTIRQGDALEVLKTLPDESVHMCVTSPPFYGLRDYGTGTWEGGDEGCDHEHGRLNSGHTADVGSRNEDGNAFRNSSRYVSQGDPTPNICGKCGARRIDRQIGLEETPQQWVTNLVGVFREVRRVLREDGTLWLEVGDSYKSTAPGTVNAPARQELVGSGFEERARMRPLLPDLKAKDLIGAPWLLAFALRADGWWLRADIIWARPNPMPESVTDRPTKSHSYVFLLAKSARYFYDADAIREEAEWAYWGKQTSPKYDGSGNGKGDLVTDRREELAARGGRNARSVWTIPTQPLAEPHYAAYPEELARRAILAGSPPGGVVLDPFLGSGTTALVARKHGRRTIGIELNPAYCQIAERRTRQLSLLGDAA
jgi:DNA modification methylase